MIKISDGPAIISIPTVPNTLLFASATYAFPGPTILSTFGIVSVPYAKAPIACAPPIEKIRSTCATFAAAKTKSFLSPLGVGTTMISSWTPATFAGIAFIRTDEG